jgi:hypothetical protein
MGCQNAGEGNLSLIEPNCDGRDGQVSLICLFLCSEMMVAVSTVPTAPAVPYQAPTEALHVPEPDAGISFLYELKPEEVRSQLGELVAEFPENSLFAKELAKLNVSSPTIIPLQK